MKNILLIEKTFCQIAIVVVFLLLSFYSNAQEKQKKWELNGYVSDVQSVMFQDINDYWVSDNLIHNRLNFNWFINNSFSASIQARNRFMYGDQIRFDTTGFYTSSIATDRGYFDLTENILDEKNYLLNTTLDRILLTYEKENLNVKLGRQRINWGQTFVWNPNDIFNSYSFFDFDYIERPGSDAVRIQYYTGATSVLELAAKVDNNENVTAGALFRFNKWNYDIQIIAGMLNETDYVAGAGWSGAIKNMSFRGEMSYFHPMDNIADTSGQFFVSLSTDFTLENSMFIQFEAFYGQQPKGQTVYSFIDYYSAPLSVKNLAFTEYNIFGQVSYPITPLVNATLSAMYYPNLKGYFVGPSVDISIKDNVDFSIFAQAFSGEFPNPQTGDDDRQDFYMGFLRLKWSF